MVSKRKLVEIVSPPYGHDSIVHVGDEERRQEWIKKKFKNITYSYETINFESRRDEKTGRFNPHSFENIGRMKIYEENSEEDFDITRFHSCDEPLYWTGCYASDRQFKKFIHPDTFAHPAKASMLLMDRIFKHLKKLGLLKKGDVVTDFMAGTGRTNIMASLHGFDSIAVELEPHFIKMIEDNKKLLEKTTGREQNWQVIQGDSRRLTELLQQKNLVGITSPPYQDINQGNSQKTQKFWEKLANDPTSNRFGRKQHPTTGIKYSSNPSNIGNLPDKKLVGITSPPFENQIVVQDKEFYKKTRIQTHRDINSSYMKANLEYSKSQQNLGNQQGESYLSAMLQVFQQASQLMPIIVTITKNPTRKGKLRRLDIDTAKLLMMCGYRIVDYHRSLLFEEKKHSTLNGKIRKDLKGRLSFFKRLSVQKGNIAAQWEDVIIAVKEGRVIE